MTSEQHECRVTVDGAAPATVMLLRRAARIAAEHGRPFMTPQDIHAALVADERAPLWWPRAGMPPLTPDAPNVVMQADLEADTLPLSYSGFRALVTAWTSHAPDVAELTKPASVSYELSGPDAAELTAMIEKS